MLNLLRNFFSGTITFFLVPALLAFLFLNNFSNVVLNESSFLRTLKENQTYEKLASEVLPSLVISVAGGQLGSGEGIPVEVLKNIVSTIDKERLSGDLEKLVAETYRYTIGETTTLEARVDLTFYTQSLQKELKPTFIKYYEGLPPCTTEQEQTQETSENLAITCRLQNKTTEEVLAEAEVDKLISELTTNTPETLIIRKNQIYFDPSSTSDTTTTQGSINQDSPSLEHIRNLALALKTSVTYLLLIVGILFVFLVISRLFNFVSVFRWVAWTLISASTVPLLISSFFLFFVQEKTVTENLSSTLEAGSNPYQANALGLLAVNVNDLGHKIFQGIQLQSLVLVIIAVALFIGAVVLEKRTHAKGSKEG